MVFTRVQRGPILAHCTLLCFHLECEEHVAQELLLRHRREQARVRTAQRSVRLPPAIRQLAPRIAPHIRRAWARGAAAAVLRPAVLRPAVAEGGAPAHGGAVVAVAGGVVPGRVAPRSVLVAGGKAREAEHRRSEGGAHHRGRGGLRAAKLREEVQHSVRVAVRPEGQHAAVELGESQGILRATPVRPHERPFDGAHHGVRARSRARDVGAEDAHHPLQELRGGVLHSLGRRQALQEREEHVAALRHPFLFLNTAKTSSKRRGCLSATLRTFQPPYVRLQIQKGTQIPILLPNSSTLLLSETVVSSVFPANERGAKLPSSRRVRHLIELRAAQDPSTSTASRSTCPSLATYYLKS